MSPIVSVVIPAAKVDDWLKDAVASALASTLDDIEVIVVLNGAPEVPVSPWAHDPRVVLQIHPEPLGPAGASLAGILAANGEFTAHLDADDLMSPDRLARQVAILAAEPDVAIVTCGTAFIDRSGHRTGAFRLPVGDDVRRQLVGNNVVPHSSMTARTAQVLEVGAYDPAMGQMEDYLLILRLARLGRVVSLPTEDAMYRIHPNQVHRASAPRPEWIGPIRVARDALASTLGMGTVELRLRAGWWLAQQHAMHRLSRLRAWKASR